MSGGHFEYAQYRINDIAEEIDQLIVDNDSTEKDEWGYEIGRHYPPEIIEKFKEGSKLLKKAQIYAQRVDWLVSGDDGEESFTRRLEEDLKELEKGFK